MEEGQQVWKPLRILGGANDLYRSFFRSVKGLNSFFGYDGGWCRSSAFYFNKKMEKQGRIGDKICTINDSIYSGYGCYHNIFDIALR